MLTPWGEAFGELADRLNQIRREHGPDAVGIYSGRPPSHNYGSALLCLPFLTALGIRKRLSAVLILCANPAVSNDSRLFKAIQERGGEVVLIDPAYRSRLNATQVTVQPRASQPYRSPHSSNSSDLG